VDLRGGVVSSGTCGRLWSLGDGEAEWQAVLWRRAVDGREVDGCEELWFEDFNFSLVRLTVTLSECVWRSVTAIASRYRGTQARPRTASFRIGKARATHMSGDIWQPRHCMHLALRVRSAIQSIRSLCLASYYTDCSVRCALETTLSSRRIERRHQRPIQRELIPRLQNIRPIPGPKHLPPIPPPLRIIDPVNPVLDLHHHAAVLLRHARPGGVVEETLGLFQREGTYVRG